MEKQENLEENLDANGTSGHDTIIEKKSKFGIVPSRLYMSQRKTRNKCTNLTPKKKKRK